MGTIDQFLSAVHLRIELLQQARTLYKARLVPDFNVIQLAFPSENRISALLSDLLSPIGRHGQDTRFLERFLSDICDWSGLVQKASKTEVETEYLISEYQCRIDILLKWPDQRAVIGIENKPWASDQRDQIADYANGLKSMKTKAWMLLYLSGDGHDPESSANNDWEKYVSCGNAKTVSYRMLGEWLGDCLRQCESERVRFFLSEFRDYVREEFTEGQKMQEQQDIIEIALKNPDYLRAAFQIGKATDEIKLRLLDKFKEQMAKLTNGKGWKIEWDGDYWHKYFNVRFIWSKNQKCYFCIEFYGSKMSGGHFGIVKRAKNNDETRNVADLPAVREALNQRLADGELSVEWPWFRMFKHPYDNWKRNDEPWVGIAEDDKPETAQWCISKAEEVYRVLKEAGLLKQL